MLYLGESNWVNALRKRFGIDKPQFAEIHKWEDIDARIRRQQPVGWFLTETLPDFIEDVHRIITSPYYNTRYYIRNRFIRKSHMLRTDCPPGEYCDTDQRILSAMSNAVIDYVEIELAYKHTWCGSEEVPNAVWRNGRCIELGLKYLEWEMELDDPNLDLYTRADSQANSAREVNAIYNWAKARPARPDPHEASGWTAYCNKYRDDLWGSDNASPGRAADSEAASKKLREIEAQYEQEDEDMLIRIIKVRRSLWT